jgi:NADH:ubiquinone oxidoreductase subunit E
MKKKLDVKICTGTFCTVMGGSELLLLESKLPESLKDMVNISGVVCTKDCENGGDKKPPIAMVGSKLYDQLDINKLLKAIEIELKAREDS